MNNKEFGLTQFDPYKNSDPLSIHDLETHLFGRFFMDRAEFYIIKSPRNKFFSSPIFSVTLYYLDGTLSQTKYVLQNNIADSLINKYGKFQITALDKVSRDILETNHVISKLNNKWQLNPQLSRYELLWTMGERQIKLRVDPQENNESIKYIDGLVNYKKMFSNVEHLR